MSPHLLLLLMCLRASYKQPDPEVSGWDSKCASHLKQLKLEIQVIRCQSFEG